MVETAPRRMSSTPRVMGMGWAGLYHVFSESFSKGGTGWTLGKSLAPHCISIFSFWQRKDQSFAALVEILVAYEF